MSCPACEEAQASNEVTYYYRWKTANIAVHGCKPHVKEVFDALNVAQAASRIAAGQVARADPIF